MRKHNPKKCSECNNPLTKENSYKYNGYYYKDCRDCKNARGRKRYREKARVKKESKWI